MAKSRKKTHPVKKQGHDHEVKAAGGRSLGETLMHSCINRARACLDGGDGIGAMEWLRQVPDGESPAGLDAAIHYQIAREAAARADWLTFERELVLAVRCGSTPLYQQRLSLARRRQSLMDDGKWSALCASVDPAQRLSISSLSPLISGVWSCGAYYARGALSGRPWTKFLRNAKHPPDSQQERDAVINIATGFFCRYIVENTSLLTKIDVVVAIPANPVRYNDRRMSLPDEIARAAERQIAVPFVFSALVYKGGADLDMRGLSWADRYRAVKGSMAVGELGIAAGKSVLVVDDVITSGATLSEAARLLREAGVADVFAMTMSHTEG